MNTTPVDIELAIKQYLKHKTRSLQYGKNHPEKCRERSKRFYDNVKKNEPEKYKAMLARKREKYNAKKLASLNVDTQSLSDSSSLSSNTNSFTCSIKPSN